MFAWDGFVNLLKGLGSRKDATIHTDFSAGLRINQQVAENLYAYSWLCAKIVDIRVEDAVRRWRTILIDDVKKKEEFNQQYIDWGVKEKIIQAAKWARAYGGAVIIPILNEDPTTPLNIDNIQPNSLINMMVLDRYNIFPETPNNNIMDRNFGQPECYSITRSGVQIHHSRVLKFDGIIPSIPIWEQEGYWGLSLFTRLFDPITAAEEVIQLIRNLVYEAKVDVYKINGLNDLVTQGSGGEELALKRISLAQEGKSIVNGIVLDKDDEYEQKSINFANLHELDDRFGYKVCGAADTPFTRIYGRSPAGMNATGDSDLTNYYDGVTAYQDNELTLKVDWLDRIMLANIGYTGEWKWEWNPVKQLTELEQSTLENNNANRDKTYLELGVIEASDIILELSKQQTYSSLTSDRTQELLANSDLEFDLDE